MARQLRIGCQTYTWEMLGADWPGTPDDILAAVAAAGYDGVEFSNAMIGEYEGAPESFAAALGRYGLADGSARVDQGLVRLADGTAVPWEPSEHVLPLSERLSAYFESPEYVTAAEAEAERLVAAGLCG